jgi:cephalosporin hydroxylase
VLYGSRPPAEDSVWNRIRDDGCDVKVFDRNIRNKEVAASSSDRPWQFGRDPKRALALALGRG